MAKDKDTGNAYEDIFGGSDLSDIEDDQPNVQGAQDISEEFDHFEEDEDQELSAAAEAEAVMAEDLGDDEDEEDGDYRQTEAGDVNRLPSFKKDPNAPKKKEKTAEQIEEARRRKERRQAEEEYASQPLPQAPLDPAAERAARLEAILSNKKKKAPRKRKPGEEDLDEMADEEVYRLRQAMDGAAEADKEAVQEGRPAIEKLKLLNEVISTLRKPHLETTILEADILTQIRRWLEPIGRNLPAVNIQRELLASLAKMDIETSQLKASELGKVVYFYGIHPKVEPGVKRQADQLVMAWMRPIIRRSAAARDRVVQRAEANASSGAPRKSGPGSKNKNANRNGERPEIGRRHASIPEAISTAYTVAPNSKISADNALLPKSNSRFKSMKARLESSKLESRRM